MYAFNPATDAPQITTPGNPWIEQTDMMDTVALLLNGFAKRCTSCNTPTRLKYLTDGLCPDCTRLAEAMDIPPNTDEV